MVSDGLLQTIKFNTKSKIAVIGVAAVLIGAIGYSAVSFVGVDSKISPQADDVETKRSRPVVPAAAVVPRVEIPAEINVGPTEKFKTINDALAFIKKHKETLDRKSRKYVTTVKVAPGTYQERIVIDNAGDSWPKGIHIVGDGPRRVVLKPVGADPVVTLNGIERLTLENFELAADGQATALKISNSLLGTQLRHLTITGFTETGVLGLGPQGFVGQEVVLENLQFHSGSAGAVGIRLIPQDHEPAHLVVSQCRLIGPMSAGILLENGGRFMEVRQSIFSDVGVGVKFSGNSPDLRKILIAHNTFHKLDHGILFAEMPLPGSSGLGIENNLFAGSKGPDTLVQTGYNEKNFLAMFRGRGIRNNWSSRPSDAKLPEGEVDLVSSAGKRGQTFQFVSTDPAHAHFLAPKPGAPHKAVGATTR